MITEYDITITLEIKAESDKEEQELYKRFKRELFNQYGGNDVTRITNIRSNRN
jgi:hypothetical protein